MSVLQRNERNRTTVTYTVVLEFARLGFRTRQGLKWKSEFVVAVPLRACLSSFRGGIFVSLLTAMAMAMPADGVIGKHLVWRKLGQDTGLGWARPRELPQTPIRAGMLHTWVFLAQANIAVD